MDHANIENAPETFHVCLPAFKLSERIVQSDILKAGSLIDVFQDGLHNLGFLICHQMGKDVFKVI
jgi:hypothetical protein